MITFKSISHFFAKALQAVKNDAPKIAAVLDGAQAAKVGVETVTAAAGGAVIVPLEDAAFAALGALAALLHAGGDAAIANLTNVGFDVVAIEKAKAALAANQQIVAVAKAL